MKQSPKSSSSPRHGSLNDQFYGPASPPATVSLRGRTLIPPTSTFARAIMGNEPSHETMKTTTTTAPQSSTKRVSNLTVLLNQQAEAQQNVAPPRAQEPAAPTSLYEHHLSFDEADSASGPPKVALGSSAPAQFHAGSSRQSPQRVVASSYLARQNSTGTVSTSALSRSGGKVRRFVHQRICLALFFVYTSLTSLTLVVQMHVQQRAWNSSTTFGLTICFHAIPERTTRSNHETETTEHARNLARSKD